MKAFRQTIQELSVNDKLDKLGHNKPLSGSRLKQLTRDFPAYEDIDLDQWQGYPHPRNSSQVTKNEIHNLISLGQFRDQWERDMVMHDKKVIKAFREYLDKHELEVDLDRIEKLRKQASPILLSLKRFYNRPRPQVLAKKLGLDLTFFPLTTAETPSYPSGHATQGRLVAKLVADEVPFEHRRNLLDIGERIGHSRQIAGAHYASDTEFGHRLGDELYRLASTRKEPELSLEYLTWELDMLNEIDFASAQALGSYKAKHKMRPTTVVNVAGKKKKAVDVLGKDAFKDDEKDKEKPKDKKELSKKETAVLDQKKERATDPEVVDSLNSVMKYLDTEQKMALELNGKKREKRMKQLSSLRDAMNNLPDEQKNTASNTFAQGLVTQGRVNSGAGKNRLGYEQTQALINKKDYLIEAYGDGSAEHVKKFVRASRPHKVSEDYVRSSFDALPKSVQKSFMGKGKVGDAGKGKHFLGYVKEDGSTTSDRNDPDIKKGKDGKPEVKRGNPGNRDRGLLVWRAINEQGMQDPYTGLPLDLSSIDLEHTVAFTNDDNGKPTEEDYLNREHDDNIIITATNTNQKKSSMSMKDFIETHVDTQKDKSKESFEKIDKAYEDVNKIGSSTEQTAKLLIEDGKLNSKVTPKTLKQSFEQDDKIYDSAREEFKKVADNPKDKKRVSTLKSELGKDTLMSMGLSRGLTSKDGRRSVKLSSDNIYRGFVLSMAASPDKQEEFKKEWENARAEGNKPENRTTGNGQKMMLRYLMDKKLISKDVLDDPKLGRAFKNALKESKLGEKLLGFNEWIS